MRAVDSLAQSQQVLRIIELQTRQKIMGEIKAFANDYHHHLEGLDVVRVDQLLDFLQDIPDDTK
jgi:hypothetical protein